MNQATSTLVLLCALIGYCCAVFYTRSSDNDYPRIGRRSFYTRGNGNHYPRIGRRDAASSGQVMLPGTPFAGYNGMEKRGIFTQSDRGSYPRQGRSSGLGGMNADDLLNERRSKLLEKFVGMKEQAEDEEMRNGMLGDTSQEGSMEERRTLSIPLDIMFLTFDTDDDGILSKDEFISGFSKYREHNPSC